MKYILLTDDENQYLVCELQHHLDCHKKERFHPLYMFDANDYEEAVKKADTWADDNKV